MEVTLIETLDVKPIESEFEILFNFKHKKGIKEIHWFTPSGKCNIWVGGCHMHHLGKLGKGQYDSLMAEMSKAKCDILTDGRDYYTTGNNNLIRIDNMASILYRANQEWDVIREDFI